MTSLIALGLMASVSIPTASALSHQEVAQCKAMGASLRVRHEEMAARGKVRITLAEAVELAGEQWQAAEALRNFGTDKAEDADIKKADYDRRKSDFDRKDMAYQSDVAALNNDLAAFNKMCAKRN